MFDGQATLPRLLHTLPTACLPVCWPGYSAQKTLPPDCLPACQAVYSAQATAHPATCLPAFLLARLLCLGYCTPCHLSVRCPGFSAKATEHPASCLPFCWPGYSAQANAHPATCLPACLLARLLCPANPAACLPSCLCAVQAVLHRLLCPGYGTPCHLPVCWPGYSTQATAHPATSLLSAQATLPRLLNTLPPACLFAGQANLTRLMHTLPPACLPVCWPG